MSDTPAARRPSLEKRQALARALLGNGRAAPASPTAPIRPREEAGPVPLSFSQQRLWFLDHWNPGSSYYNVPIALRLRGSSNRCRWHQRRREWRSCEWYQRWRRRRCSWWRGGRRCRRNQDAPAQRSEICSQKYSPPEDDHEATLKNELFITRRRCWIKRAAVYSTHLEVPAGCAA